MSGVGTNSCLSCFTFHDVPKNAAIRPLRDVEEWGAGVFLKVPIDRSKSLGDGQRDAVAPDVLAERVHIGGRLAVRGGVLGVGIRPG